MNVPAIRQLVGVRASALVGGGVVALLFLLVTQVGVASATAVTVSLDAAGMSYWANESHIATTCGTITANQSRELHGTAQGSVGAFMQNLTIPNHATLTKLTVVAHDNDAQYGTDAYLVRKRMTPGAVSDGLNGGYATLSHVATSGPGASGGITRQSTTTIAMPVVDTLNFAYMAVIVNCKDTVDPIGVQVTFTH